MVHYNTVVGFIRTHSVPFVTVTVACWTHTRVTVVFPSVVAVVDRMLAYVFLDHNVRITYLVDTVPLHCHASRTYTTTPTGYVDNV